MRRPGTHEPLARAALLAALLALAVAVSPASSAAADKKPDLQAQIEDQQAKIKKLDAEIAEQQRKLNETSGQAKTLDSAVKTLDASVKKIDTSIKKTEVGIQKHELVIQSLSQTIAQNQAAAARDRAAVARLLSSLDVVRTTSGLERLLAADDLGTFWDSVDATNQARDELRAAAATLARSTEQLTSAQLLAETEKEQLAQSKQALSGQRESVATTKAEKADLLAQTKSQEAAYKKALDAKLAKKAEFESALREFESQLNISVSTSGYPAAASGVIGWPVEGLAKITQLFGGTEFAKLHAQAYTRPFHPGVDFGVPIGTPIVAVLPGTVQALDNTDAVRGCESWGKWVLVKHPNGLSSLYAHLSGFAVSVGDAVKSGQTIGYSGQTGYATGPHLHLTLYASEGVQVRRFEEFKKVTGCAGATTPVASPEAYLDPMDYLPSSGFQMFL